MKKGGHIHTPDDGRGPRDVFVNWKQVFGVILADTKRGLVRVIGNPIKLDKHRKRVLWKVLRGSVDVNLMSEQK